MSGNNHKTATVEKKDLIFWATHYADGRLNKNEDISGQVDVAAIE